LNVKQALQLPRDKGDVRSLVDSSEAENDASVESQAGRENRKTKSKAHCHKVSLKVGQRKAEMCHASGFLDWIA